MIVESLIVDDRWLTFDCCKAKLSKGSKVSMDDIHYWNSEIQNAIKAGLARVVGTPPSTPPAGLPNAAEPRVRFKNIFDKRLAFACVNSGVEPGATIDIPASKVLDREIQNAIAWRMLRDIDSPEEAQVPQGEPQTPAKLDEITASDILPDAPGSMAVDLTPPSINPDETQVRTARPSPKKAGKAKPITRVGEDGDEGDDGIDAMAHPSVVREPKANVKKAAKPAPIEVDVETEAAPVAADDDFDFLDAVFEGK